MTIASLAFASIGQEGLFYASLCGGAVFQAFLMIQWGKHLASLPSSRVTSSILLSMAFGHMCSALCCLIPAAASSVLVASLPLASAAGLFAKTDVKAPIPPIETGLPPRRIVSLAISLILIGGLFGYLKSSLRPLNIDFAVLDMCSSAISCAMLLIIFSSGSRKPFYGLYMATMFFLIASSATLASGILIQPGIDLFVLLPMQQSLLGTALIIAPTLTIPLKSGKNIRLFGWGFTLFYLAAALGNTAGSALAPMLQIGLSEKALMLALAALAMHFVLFRESDIQLVVQNHSIEVASAQKLFLDRYSRLADRFDLTDRERDVLYLWAQGFSAKGIADRLVLSQSTIRTHIRHIYAKTDTKDRNSLIELSQTL